MKRLSLILVLCLLLSLFVACGVPSSDGGGTDTVSAQETLSESVSETEGETEPPIPTAKERYYIMLINSAYLSRSDQNVVAVLPALYPTHDVFVLDVKDCADAFAVYELLQTETRDKEGTLDGIQILGSADTVPSFLIDYRVELPSGHSTAESFFSDYFYANLENESEDLYAFNLADHFTAEDGISLVPHHRVVRLPLGSGELNGYFERYGEYLETQSDQRPAIVGFSSSIFRYGSVTAVDDLAYFLRRAQEEWGILDAVELYANQEGLYLTPVSVKGDVTAENLQRENQEGVKEFFLLGHGSSEGMVRTVFSEAGEDTSAFFLHYSELESVFAANPYFLNLHSCNTAEGMGRNFVRSALNGNCLGAFGATSTIANNGISCLVPKEEMLSTSNFFGFHYAYLQALHDGMTRSQAFFAAQTAYEGTLAACAKEEMNYTANYQFGYHNLMTYSNFGILEPEVSVFPALEDVGTNNYDVPMEKQYVYLTNGRETGSSVLLTARALTSVGGGVLASVSKIKACPLDNGYVRFYVNVKGEVGCDVAFLSSVGMYLRNDILFGKSSTLVFDLSRESMESQQDLALFFEQGERRIVWYLASLDSIPTE